MGAERLKGLLGIAVAVLTVGSVGAASGDLRLVEAARDGDEAAVRTLLEARTDVNEAQPDGVTALHWAAQRDDLAMAELLLQRGAKVDAANDYGITSLSLACTNGSAVMVERLLKAGANPNATQQSGETVLMTCSRTGNAEAVKKLLVQGADARATESRSGQTALMWAVSEKHAKVVGALVEHGADIRAHSQGGFTPLLFAARVGDLESTRILLAAGADLKETTSDGMSVLLMAAASGHEELSIFLLEKGADPNATDRAGMTALHYAVQKGISTINRVERLYYNSYLFRPNMLELTKALLARGANPNARLSKNPQKFSGVLTLAGATPFFLAAAVGDVNVMRVLAAGGADPLLTVENNTTPLMVAAGIGRHGTREAEESRNAQEAVKLAVELGANVNAVNKDGETALHGAAYAGEDDIIRFLAQKGAHLDAKDKYGQTPWSIAEGIVPPTLLKHKEKPLGSRQSSARLLRNLGSNTEH
jgi:uncharacterized protein